MDDEPPIDCAARCRNLAEATFELAGQAENPEIIGDYLAITAKLISCADRQDRLGRL